MWVRSLGQEYPVEEGMATHSSILARKIPWTEELGGLGALGCKESDTTKQLSTTTRCNFILALALPSAK